MAQLVRGHQFERCVEQVRLDAIERGLRIGVAAHRQHQFAAAVNETQRQRCGARCRLRLHHDVQRELCLLGECDHGPDALQPAHLDFGQVSREAG